MAEITFLAPGSCQLEVTAQGDAGTDTGVDLASVSWTIEQALIAGCRFSPSAGDVHIDRNGVLTIGRSLFDRINQADGDENIPGQCTLVIRAESTITKTVLDRLKVLVGYPGEAGGSGGGGGDFTLASVIFVKDTEADFIVACPNVYDDNLYSYVDSADIDGETPVDVVLYKGSAQIYIDSEIVNVGSVSGSAEISGLTGAVITGDCTITIVNATS